MQILPMKNKSYDKAFSEVRVILRNTEEELVNRIPKSFKNFIEQNYDKNYEVPQINVNKKLDEQGLLDETVTIISLIYRNYWCNESEREEYDKLVKNNEWKLQEELREKYNPDNLFKKKEESEEENLAVQQAMIAYKEPVFKRIWLKIKSIFYHFDNLF